MQLNNERILPVAQPTAWAALNDDAMLQASIPGCESLTRSAPDTLDAVVTLSVGPVRARFKGRLTLQDIDAPNGYSMAFEGQGGAAGFSKGTARVRLTPIDAHSTRLSYEAQVQIGGKLAQLGSRVIDGASQKVIGEFFTRFEAQLVAASQPATPADAAAPTTEAVVAQSWWRTLLRRWLGFLKGRRAA